MIHREKWDAQQAMRDLKQSLERLNRRPRILLVEDDDLMVELARHYLDAYGDVTVVGDGAEAIRVLLMDHFDVSFIDLNIPSIRGEQVIARVRSLKPTQKFVVLTVAADKDITQRLLADGALQVIEKPLKKEHLERLFR